MIQEVKDELMLRKKLFILEFARATGDVDLNKKLTKWEYFYNFHRLHGAFDGKTPYEALSSMLKKSVDVSNRI